MRMQLSCSIVLPTFLLIIGACMFCICGYIAIDETLNLFDQFGPIEGRGNPAKDAPPRYIDNPKTHKQELVNPNNPGNIFPSVARGMQWYLISIGAVTIVTSFVTAFIVFKSKNALVDAVYNGRLGSWTNPRYMAPTHVYLFSLTLIWIVSSGLAVLPIVEFVITAQRCRDLNNPNYGLGVKQSICIDLVQYGLIPFREMHNSGYGLICGPGPHIPPWGNLEGLCKNYATAYNLFITCFAGAGIVIIAMIFYISRLVSISNRLELLFEEGPEIGHGYYKPSSRHQASNFSGIEMSEHKKSQSVYNPNYEHNVFLLDPSAQETSNVEGSTYGVLPVPPGSDGHVLKKEYFGSAGDYPASRSSKKSLVRSSSSSLANGTDSLPPSKRSRHPTIDSMEKSRPKGSIADVSKRSRNQVLAPSFDLESDPHESSDAPSEHTRSTIALRTRPKKSKSRSTRSDPDLYRKSSRRQVSNRRPPKIDEYDSPPSDFYMQQDLQRRTSRLSSKARNEY